MIVEIKNIGPLADVTLDLSKPLTVFTGQNRTGKTLAAFACYGVFQKKTEFSPTETFLKFDKKKTIDLLEPIKNLIAENNFNFRELLNHSFFNAFLDPILNILIEKKELRSFLDSKRAIEKESKIICNSGIDFEEFKKNLDSIDDSFFDFSPMMAKLKHNLEIQSEIDSNAFRFLLIIILHKFSEEFLKFTLRQIFFLPAERNALNVYSHELVGAQFRSRLSPVFNPPYARPVYDYVKFIHDLESIREEEGDENISKLPSQFLDPLIGGTVVITKEGSLEYKTPKGPVDFHLAASSVKSLSGLYVYLKHIAEVDNTVIFIDEPELNLHPAAQRMVARFIARMVNAGIKVVISTHSDYIIRQLNNLLILGGARNTQEEKTLKLMQKYGYSDDELLTADQVNTYHFTLDRGVENLSVVDNDIEAPEIDDVIEKSQQETYDIFSTLLDD